MRDYNLFKNFFPRNIDEDSFIKDYFQCLAKKLGVVGDASVCDYYIYSKDKALCSFHMSDDYDDDDFEFVDPEAIMKSVKGKNPKIIAMAVLHSEKGYFFIDSANDTVSGYYDMIYPLYNQRTICPVAELKKEFYNKEYLDKMYETEFCSTVPYFFSKHSYSDAILVKKGDLYGIIGRLGNELIPVRYKEIKPLDFEKTYERVMDDCPGTDIRQYGTTGLYVCKNDHYDYDVYDLNGNMIFTHIGNIYPCKEEVIYPKLCTEACEYTYPDKVTVTHIYVQMIYEEPTPDMKEFMEENPDEIVYIPLSDYHYKYKVSELYKSIKSFKSDKAPVQLNTVDNSDSDYKHVIFSLKPKNGYQVG